MTSLAEILQGAMGIGSASAAEPQWQERGGLQTQVTSGAGGMPQQPYSSPNVTAGRAAQTLDQIRQLAKMLEARGIAPDVALRMATQR